MTPRPTSIGPASTRWVSALFARVDSARDSGRTAFELDGRSITFGELEELSRRYAAGLLNIGVAQGDRVACLLPSSLELVVALLGAYRIGAIHLPINTRYRTAEVRHILEDSGACAVVVQRSGEHWDILEAQRSEGLHVPRIVVPAPARRAKAVRVVAGDHAWQTLLEHAPLAGPPVPGDEDLALLIYTSGTTAKSKGVELPFRAVGANIDALTRAWAWASSDVLVLALPLFHVHGLCIGVHGTLLRGNSATIHASFDARRVAAELGADGTIFMGVPTMYALLARAMDEDPALAGQIAGARLLTAGSAALSVNLFERFERDTGHRILERYGMSETLLTLSNPYDGERRRGSVGRAVAGGEVRVVDDEMNDVAPGEVGQIVVRGISLMRGYWEQPAKTAEAFRDGWFLTGDAATIADDGYVSIVGRRSVDIIKSGGYKISAREIEEVVERNEHVLEVAVVGVADRVWGERIVAFVVRADTGRERSAKALADEIMANCGAALADYKRVREVRFVEEIPRNALGKVQKHRLRG